MDFQPNPFRAEGRWFRGNTHSHSTVSDGRVTLEERFAQYREGGYDFLVITDHGRVSDVSPFAAPGFLPISGSEIHPPNPYGGDRYHFVAIGLREPVPYDNRHPNDVLADVRAQGGLAVLCHPYWCGHMLRDFTPLRGYFAVEVYNDTCERLIGKGNSEPHWDELLDNVGPVWGIAADDSHGVSEDVFHAWVMVRAPELTQEAVFKSLEAGLFYATQGPEIHDMWLEGGPGSRGQINVRCSPAQAITFKAQRSRGRRFQAQGTPLESAAYTLTGSERYVRVEVTDEAGRKAWSNPVFLRVADAS